MWQAVVRIDVVIKKRAFNETILASHKRAKDGNGRLHLLGLVRRSRWRRHHPTLRAARSREGAGRARVLHPLLRSCTRTCSRRW
ncbi:hypothetical protein B0H19DRAFT_704680 [Mycena capillaripes]|nr:hypothetical protein B0H19DRAFT_704680 [Mycena capillaripes]